MLSTSESQTYTVAKDLAAGLKAPTHILLYGDLGAGKTLFSKGLADGFGVTDLDEVSSPTFTLINQYAGRMKVYHIDLYRIEPGTPGSLDGWATILGSVPSARATNILWRGEYSPLENATDWPSGE